MPSGRTVRAATKSMLSVATNSAAIAPTHGPASRSPSNHVKTIAPSAPNKGSNRACHTPMPITLNAAPSAIGMAGGRTSTTDPESVGGYIDMRMRPSREKVHAAKPMTLDQALYEMELVGHDFYLFVDADSHRPSVVYRRRGYDYGVIALDVDSTA